MLQEIGGDTGQESIRECWQGPEGVTGSVATEAGDWTTERLGRRLKRMGLVLYARMMDPYDTLVSLYLMPFAHRYFSIIEHYRALWVVHQ
jgi:hypothetical protein